MNKKTKPNKQSFEIIKNVHYILQSNNPKWIHMNDAGPFYSLENLCEEIVYSIMFDNKKFANMNYENGAECEYFEAVKNRYIRLLSKSIKPIELEGREVPVFNEFEQKISEVLRNDWNPIGFGSMLPKDEYDSYVPRVYQLLLEGAEQKTIESFLEHIETTVIGLTRKKSYVAKMELHTTNIAIKLCTIKEEMRIIKLA